MTVLGTLLEQHRVRLAERGAVLRSDEVEAIGWYDDDYAYLMPEAARRRVATFLRESGESWSHTAHALHKALVRKGYADPGPDGRPEIQMRVGDTRRRVLRLRLAALRGAVQTNGSVIEAGGDVATVVPAVGVGRRRADVDLEVVSAGAPQRIGPTHALVADQDALAVRCPTAITARSGR